jgi:hypothetical protein
MTEKLLAKGSLARGTIEFKDNYTLPKYVFHRRKQLSPDVENSLKNDWKTVYTGHLSTGLAVC